MSQKFSPTSQLESWKQAQIPLLSLFFSFKCCASKPNHFLKNSRTWVGSEVRVQSGEEEDSFFKLEGICFFPHTKARRTGIWRLGMYCLLQRNSKESLCAILCFPIGLWQQHQRQQILQFYIWKEAFSSHKGQKTLLKTLKPNYSTSHGLKDWDLWDTHVISPWGMGAALLGLEQRVFLYLTSIKLIFKMSILAGCFHFPSYWIVMIIMQATTIPFIKAPNGKCTLHENIQGI